MPGQRTTETIVASPGLVAVLERLEEGHVDYEVVEHKPTYTSADESRAAGYPLAATAKTLALHDHDGYRLVTIPASRKLDLARARAVLGASAHLRLATEEEIAEEFPGVEVGALPPFSLAGRLPQVVDVRLLYRDRIAFPGGDHRHSVAIDPRDMLRAAEPIVADVCVHTDVHKGFADLPHI